MFSGCSPSDFCLAAIPCFSQELSSNLLVPTASNILGSPISWYLILVQWFSAFLML